MKTLTHTLAFACTITGCFAWWKIDAGMTEEQIDGAVEMTKKFQTPGILSAMILAISAFREIADGVDSSIMYTSAPLIAI